MGYDPAKDPKVARDIVVEEVLVSFDLSWPIW